MPRTAKRRPETPDVAPSQTYGQATEQLAAQKALPIPDDGGPKAMPGGGGGGPSTSPASPPPPAPREVGDDLAMVAEAMPEPDPSMALNARSNRPMEDIMAGGPNSEAMMRKAAPRSSPTADLLSDLASSTNNETIRRIAEMAARRGV